MKCKKYEKLGKIMADSIIKGTETVNVELKDKASTLSTDAIDIMNEI